MVLCLVLFQTRHDFLLVGYGRMCCFFARYNLESIAMLVLSTTAPYVKSTVLTSLKLNQ